MSSVKVQRISLAEKRFLRYRRFCALIVVSAPSFFLLPGRDNRSKGSGKEHATLARKKTRMQTLLLVLIIGIFIAVCYLTYREAAQKRAHEKKRNHYDDRV